MSKDYIRSNPALDQLARRGQAPDEAALTVSQLNRQARQLLETQIGMVKVQGEISNFTAAASGHWYFTLKDDNAQLRCAMFRNRNQSLRFRPGNGQLVTVRGRLGLYEARGDYQLVAENMLAGGQGDLQRQFEELKQKLSAAGWFDPENKQALPEKPMHIGVVTSAKGAALHDITSVMAKRYPATRISVLPCAVQGDLAAAEIAARIDMANRLNAQLDPPIEALIVGRGGGSLEDLWAFNSELVAGAIYHSKIPVVSAVGHETDFTIADFVADYRAPTPSAAAEVLTPDRAELLAILKRQQHRMGLGLGKILQSRTASVQQLSRRLKHPSQRIEAQAQRLDDLDGRLRRVIRGYTTQRNQHLARLAVDLTRFQPGTRIQNRRTELDGQQQRLKRAISVAHERRLQTVAQLAGQLDAVSPLATLARGYAIVQDGDGKIVMHKEQVSVGESLAVKISDGTLITRVDAVE